MAFLVNGLFKDVLTSAKEKIRRLQVDVGNTGFFDGREFRYFREFSIPTGGSLFIRVTVPELGIILRLQSLTVDTGAVRFRAWRDATVTGATWTEPASPSSGIFANNNLPSAPEYTRLTVIEESVVGTISGGAVAEVKRVRSAGATAQRTSVGSQFQGERGIGAGSYILQLENLQNETSTGTYDLIFEERIGQG